MIASAVASRLSLLCLLMTYATAESIVSPIQNLEASLAASMAHSMTVAIRSRDDCVVLVRQTQTGSASKLLARPSTGKSVERHGLLLNDSPPSRTSSSRWRLLSPKCLCTMTGFAADIAHVTKVLARIAEAHQMVYSEPIPSRKIIRSISSILQRAAQRDGGRPYGIHSLFVGLDDHPKDGFHIYSCDPTGLYRHAANGQTAIGKYSDVVRKELPDGSRTPDDAASALRACLTAMVQAYQKHDVTLHSPSHTLEGLLICKSADGDCEVASLSHEFLEQSFREIVLEHQKDNTRS